jgi:hypothetical protein
MTLDTTSTKYRSKRSLSRHEPPAGYPKIGRRDVFEAVAAVFPWWVGSRILCLLGLLAARAGYAGPGMEGPDTYDVWDVGWYLHIAKSGYAYTDPLTADGAPAFLPLMPFVMRWGGVLLGGHPLVAGGIAANAAALVAAASLFLLMRMGLRPGRPLSRQAALIGTSIFLISPFGLPLFLAYTEPLLLAFALPAWIAARHRIWWMAGSLASVAVLSRVTGISYAFGIGVMFLVYAWPSGCSPRTALSWWQWAKQVLRPSFLWILLPLGVLLWWNFRLYQLTGRPDAVTHAEATSWNREIVAPWTGFMNSTEVLTRGGDNTVLLEITATLIILAVSVVVGVLRMWPEMALTASAVLVLMSNSIWASSLRAITVIFPFWMLVALVGNRIAQVKNGLSWLVVFLCLSGLGLFWCELLIANNIFVL